MAKGGGVAVSQSAMCTFYNVPYQCRSRDTASTVLYASRILQDTRIVVWVTVHAKSNVWLLFLIV